MAPTPNPPAFISFRRNPVRRRSSLPAFSGSLRKMTADEPARSPIIGRVICGLACGTLLLAPGCTSGSANERSPSAPPGASHAAPAADNSPAPPRETPAPRLPAAQPAMPAPPVAEAFPAEIPVYPNGSITKSESGPDGAVLLLSTQKSWEDLRDFYAATLVPAGWNIVDATAPGQTRMRFEKDGRNLVVQMQPGRQEEKLVRILWTTNSAPRQ
jgi:hypothetical protein